MKPTHAGFVILIAVSFAVFTGCTKQKETEASLRAIADTSQQVPVPPQHPAPDLTPTSATIGPKGATLSSSDNRLSLSVPPGALAADTQVSIQPTKGSDDGLGTAYRLMPEGVTFSQPVTLAWHLSEEDLAQTNLDNLNVSSQAANGAWTIQEGTQRDEATHTLSVSVSHFSLWQLAQIMYIVPRASRVYVGDSLDLSMDWDWKLYDKGPHPAPAPDSDDLTAPPGEPEEAKKLGIAIETAVWRVNGQAGGNHAVGTIKAQGWPQWADYVAPNQEPSPNRVVTVSAEVTVGTHKAIATALVEVLPQVFHVTGHSHITQFDGTTVTSNFTFTPVHSFERRGHQVGRQRYEILDGTVYYKGPKKTGAGCDLDIRPAHHPLQPKEGSLYIDSQNPNVYLLSGGGQAVWSAMYKTDCPNGTQYLQSSVSAAWWPTDPSQMTMAGPTMFPVNLKTDKSITIPVDTPFGKGTVSLYPQWGPPLEQPEN